MANKRLLLILDNADLLLVGDSVGAILAHAPLVKILATSREALNLQQEWFHPLDGLGTTAVDGAITGTTNGEFADAIQLFQQAARRANPEFNYARDRVHVEKICRLVDGAPLGIELAAAWLKALSCEQVAQELAQSLDFLSTSLRNIPARHRSMRVVLDQTWYYLSSEEQQAFRRLSIFAGGCRAEAAEHVAEVSLWMLASLVEKSVLQHMHDGRYRIHSLLRQLGAEKLASNPAELVSAQALHCDVYMTFLREHRQSIAGPEQKRVLAEVQEEMDNIRIAWVHASRHGYVVESNEALPVLFRYLWTRGRYEDGERMTAQALEQLDETTLTNGQATVKIALTVRRAQFVIARGVGGLGLVAWSRGDLEQAIDLMADRMVRMQELGHEVEVYTSVNLLCGIHAHAGSYAEAKELLGGYPGMRDTYWTAQIQVGAGAFAEAMRYLPQETAAMLATNNRHDLASYLIAWAMLLMSDCALSQDRASPEATILLPRAERVRTALEIISLLRTYDECRADTRKRSEDLLGQWQSELLPFQSGSEDHIREDRSIEELAGEMLTIRLT